LDGLRGASAIDANIEFCILATESAAPECQGSLIVLGSLTAPIWVLECHIAGNDAGVRNLHILLILPFSLTMEKGGSSSLFWPVLLCWY
jgi:hypothetical protein